MMERDVDAFGQICEKQEGSGDGPDGNIGSDEKPDWGPETSPLTALNADGELNAASSALLESDSDVLGAATGVPHIGSAWDRFADFDSSAFAYADAEAGSETGAHAECMAGAGAGGSNAQAFEQGISPHESALRWLLDNALEMEDEPTDGEGDGLAPAPGAGQRTDSDADLGADAGSADEISFEIGPDAEVGVVAGPDLLDRIADIPQKLAFKIGEAAEMIGVKQYVLRYWESEFEQLRPKKSKNNQRIYSRRDVETALMIRKLLYVDRFSIEGARSALRQLKREVKEEKGARAALGAHEAAIKGLRALIARIDRARDRLAERL